MHPFTFWITSSGERYGFEISRVEIEKNSITEKVLIRKLPFSKEMEESIEAIAEIFSFLTKMPVHVDEKRPPRIFSVDEIDHVISSLREKYEEFLIRNVFAYQKRMRA